MHKSKEEKPRAIAHRKLSRKEEIKGGKDSHMHPDHHHKAIKFHVAALQKMAKSALKRHKEKQ